LAARILTIIRIRNLAEKSAENTLFSIASIGSNFDLGKLCFALIVWSQIFEKKGPQNLKKKSIILIFKTLIKSNHSFYRSDDPSVVLSRLEWIIITIVLPLAIVLLPLVVAELTDNVEFLVAFTGSYAGVGVQYVLPALLMWGAKKRMVAAQVPKEFQSPFRHAAWIGALLVWATFAVIVVTVNHVISRV